MVFFPLFSSAADGPSHGSSPSFSSPEEEKIGNSVFLFFLRDGAAEESLPFPLFSPSPSPPGFKESPSFFPTDKA